MESGHRFDAQTLHSFIQAVFRQMGSEEQEAKLVADHLIAANTPNDRVERAIAATTALIVFIINLSQVIFV